MKETLGRLRIVRFLASAYRIKAVRILIPVAIFGFVIWLLQRELREVKLGVMLTEVRRIPHGSILAILLFSLLSAAVMAGYDFVIRRHFKFEVSLSRTFRISWISNTFNNLLGFAGLTGAGVRSLLYRKSGVRPSTVTAAVVFLSPVVLNGLSVMAWLEIFGIFKASYLLHSHYWLTFAVWGIALYLPLFVALQRTSLFAKWFHTEGKERFPWRTILGSIGASSLEWIFAGLTFSLITSKVLGDIPLPEMLGMYTVAAVGGIISMAPGGVGAFDLTILLGLKGLGFPAERVMAVLVLYRLFYYIIPFFIGLLLTAVELGLSNRKSLDSSESVEMEVPLTKWQRLWGWQGQFGYLNDLGAWAIGKLVLVSGLVLLLSAAMPGLENRSQLAETVLSLPVMKLSHQLSVMIGFMLIVLSHGISRQLKRAYIWTIVLLLCGALFTFMKAFDFEVSILLLIVAVMLWKSRLKFHRIRVPIVLISVVFWFLLSLALALIYYWLGSHLHMSWLKHLHLKEPFAHGRMSPHDYALDTMIGFTGAWILLILIFSLNSSGVRKKR